MIFTTADCVPKAVGVKAMDKVLAVFANKEEAGIAVTLKLVAFAPVKYI